MICFRSNSSAKVADSFQGTTNTHSSIWRRNQVQRHKKSFDDNELVKNEYRKKLVGSNDTSEFEILIRTGNVPKRWRELYFYQAYEIKGDRLTKIPE
jgi:hypothetical protein